MGAMHLLLRKAAVANNMSLYFYGFWNTKKEVFLTWKQIWKCVCRERVVVLILTNTNWYNEDGRKNTAVVFKMPF
jgi:hypothetical protein